MNEDWPLIIEKLKGEQEKLAPGDIGILDIEAVIQGIKADALEGNYGHAKYFANTPGAKEGALDIIRDKVREILPEEPTSSNKEIK